MKTAAQVVVFRFPQTDKARGKLRPALLISQVPGPFDDSLVCMITSQLRHQVDHFDEVVRTDVENFGTSGSKSESLIRLGRLAVVDGSVLLGAIGQIADSRIERIKRKIRNWCSTKWRFRAFCFGLHCAE